MAAVAEKKKTKEEKKKSKRVAADLALAGRMKELKASQEAAKNVYTGSVDGQLGQDEPASGGQLGQDEPASVGLVSGKDTSVGLVSGKADLGTAGGVDASGGVGDPGVVDPQDPQVMDHEARQGGDVAMQD